MKPKIPLKETIENLADANPEVEGNPVYLILEVWDRQGLKFYPYQRDMLMSGDLYSPESILRELRRHIAAKREKGKKSKK
jgi:predicted nucleic acid-binding protein